MLLLSVLSPVATPSVSNPSRKQTQGAGRRAWALQPSRPPEELASERSRGLRAVRRVLEAQREVWGSPCKARACERGSYASDWSPMPTVPDPVIRALTDDGSVRFLLARTTLTCREAERKQSGPREPVYGTGPGCPAVYR